MTPRQLCGTLALLLCTLAFGQRIAQGSPEDSPNAPLPEGLVAIVGELKLSYDGLCNAAVQQTMQRLKTQRSGPRAILEQLIEEHMVEQECRRLGILVTDADMDKQWAEWDGRIRRSSNGDKTLMDIVREQGTSMAEFRLQLRHVLRKDRLSEHPTYLGKTLPANENARLQQVGIVVNELRKKTKIEYGVLIQEYAEAEPRIAPAVLGAGVVASVNGEPIQAIEYGQQLVLRLPSDEVREILDQECKTALMTAEGVRLSDAELDEELELLRQLWPLEREFQQQVAWRTVVFSDRFHAEFKTTESDIRNHRFYRGLFGLVRRLRAEVTEEEIAKEFEDGKEARYGAHLIVTDIKVDFAQERSAFQSNTMRSKREAYELAKGVAQSLARGIPFEKLVNDISNKQDRTFTATQLRLYNSDRDRILYDYASRLRDGDVSSPVETLSEVHVLKREEARPARAAAEIRPVLIERLARQKARLWLDERIQTPGVVRIRWPLPIRSTPGR